MKLHYRKRPDRIPKAAAWFLVIAGFLLGSLFTFGTQYWNLSVSRKEAIYTEGTFASCEEIYGRTGTVNELKVVFQDREPLFIDGSCCSQSVLNKMAILRSGSVLSMYVHPNSSTLLEIRHENDMILSFDQTVEKLSSEATGFLVLGILMYLAAIYGSVKCIKKQ